MDLPRPDQAAWDRLTSDPRPLAQRLTEVADHLDAAAAALSKREAANHLNPVPGARVVLAQDPDGCAALRLDVIMISTLANWMCFAVPESCPFFIALGATIALTAWWAGC